MLGLAVGLAVWLLAVGCWLLAVWLSGCLALLLSGCLAVGDWVLFGLRGLCPREETKKKQ